MRHAPPTSLARLGSALAVAGLLVGCASGDDDAGASSSTVATDETSVALETTTTPTDPPATDPPTTDPPATDPPPTEPPAAGSAATDPPASEPPEVDEAPGADEGADEGDCLIGDWVVTEAQMDAYYAGLMSTLEAPIGLDASGSAPLAFRSDGTYEWAPGFALTVEVAGQVGNGDVAGTITGAWTAVDGVVATSSEANSVTVSIDVNGVTFDGADLANGLLNSSPVDGVAYSCSGPTPVLDFRTADAAVTVPVALTPA